jgi:hypothetical protein
MRGTSADRIKVAYTILILPIAASRFSSFAGKDVPFEVTVFRRVVFHIAIFNGL